MVKTGTIRELNSLALALLTFGWAYQLPIGTFQVPVVLALVLCAALISGVNRAVVLRAAIFGLTLCAICVVQWLWAPDIFNPTRTTISMVSLVVFSASASHCALNFSAESYWKYSRYALFLQVCLQVFQIIARPPGVDLSAHYFLPTPRAPGLFPEPSYVALSLFPLIYSLVSDPRKTASYLGISGMAALSVVVIICPSTTMIALLAIAFVFRRGAVMPILALLTIALLYLSDRQTMYILFGSQIADRVLDLKGLLVGDIKINKGLNQSSLLFYKGYEMASFSAKNYPLGVGLNNFQSLNLNSSVSGLSENLRLKNMFDGTSLLFKGIGEFGALFLVAAAISLKKFFELRRAQSHSRECVVLAGMTLTFVAGFIRGVGFFDGPVLAAIAISFLLPSLDAAQGEVAHSSKRRNSSQEGVI